MSYLSALGGDRCEHDGGKPQPAVVIILCDDIHQALKGLVSLGKVPCFKMEPACTARIIGNESNLTLSSRLSIASCAMSSKPMQHCTLEMVHGLQVRQAPGDDATMDGRKKRIPHPCRRTQSIAKTVPDTVRQPIGQDLPSIDWASLWLAFDFMALSIHSLASGKSPVRPDRHASLSAQSQ